MTGVFTPLRTTADLDAAFRASFTRPVLLFKHSRSCGISMQAYDEVRAWLAEGNGGAPPAYLITVQTDRAVSSEIAARLAIRHESPQAILVRDGLAIWHASHFRVTPGELAAALGRDLTDRTTPASLPTKA